MAMRPALTPAAQSGLSGDLAAAIGIAAVRYAVWPTIISGWAASHSSSMDCGSKIIRAFGSRASAPPDKMKAPAAPREMIIWRRGLRSSKEPNFTVTA